MISGKPFGYIVFIPLCIGLKQLIPVPPFIGEVCSKKTLKMSK